jgi:uncharacterized lipoprotein YmbA
MRALLLSLPLAVGLVATGCLGFRPARDTTRHFLLSVPAGDAGDAGSGTAADASAGLAVGLAPVGLPAYLDSSWVAVRHGENEIVYSATHRWGERLEQGVRRVLALHLERRLAPARIAARSWRPDAVTWEVTVELEHCEVANEGRAWVEGHWRVNRPLSSDVIQYGEHRIERMGPPPDQDPVGATAALSEALAEFARQMAAGIERLPR